MLAMSTSVLWCVETQYCPYRLNGAEMLTVQKGGCQGNGSTYGYRSDRMLACLHFKLYNQPVTSEWPAMNLVVECTTTSAPSARIQQTNQ
jgi:hypothetical protein